MAVCFKCCGELNGSEVIHGLHELCFRAWFKLTPDDLTEFGNCAIRSEHGDPSLHKIMNVSSFQGTFKKYSAELNRLNYILKVQDDDYPELPKMEYLSNQIAHAVGLKIPKYYLIRFLNEMDAFVVHNFMDNHRSGNLIHIYHYIEAGKPFSCQTIIEIIEKKTKRLEAVKKFVWLCLFDALIGNHDRHGRNIAFIETSKGFELAPFYDNPSYLGIEEYTLLRAQHSPKGKIETLLTNEPTLKDYLIEFDQMGYGKWIKEFHKKVLKSQITHLVENSFLSEKRKQALLDLIKRRLEEFSYVILS